MISDIANHAIVIRKDIKVTFKVTSSKCKLDLFISAFFMRGFINSTTNEVQSMYSVRTQLLPVYVVLCTYTVITCLLFSSSRILSIFILLIRSFGKIIVVLFGIYYPPHDVS